MIVAGIGCRKGASTGDVVDAVNDALTGFGIAALRLTALATAEMKRDEPGILGAGQRLGIGVTIVPDDALRLADARTISRSDRVLALAGVSSLSEAAALAAAGADSRLLGPRLSMGPVTCAIAVSGEDR